MPSLPISEVQSAIKANGFQWEARETEISRLARNVEPGTLFGLSLSEPDRRSLMIASVEESTKFSVAVPAPPMIDWRNNAGNFVTPVRFQATCGACVAFATCAALESRALIGAQTPDKDLDLAESHLFACGGGRCASGWDFEAALRQAQNVGVGLERNFPYQSRDVPCSQIPSAIKVAAWTKITTMNARKQAVAQNGPVIAGMRVFSDFFQYGSGIYKHATGGFEGLHAVCVVGYDDRDTCWIVKNSWRQDWGERGYVRIAYGECGLDSEFPFFDPEIVTVATPTS